MSVKAIVTAALLAFVAVSVGYLIVSETRTVAESPAPAVSENPAAGDEASQPVARPAHQVVAYYFHYTQRCPTCRKIERLAQEALQARFADALQRGELEWRVLNMDEPPNEHFVSDYALVASSLVLVDVHEGIQRAWTNMARVWELVHDETAFGAYVAGQAREYLEP